MKANADRLPQALVPNRFGDFTQDRQAVLQQVEDLRNEKITYKIREFSLMKIPLVIVLGKAEVDQNLVSVRKRGSKESNSKSLAEFLEDVKGELEQDA